MAEHTEAEKQHFTRSMHALHAGGLHRALGIPSDETIPLERKEHAAHSPNAHIAAMGRLAVAMHGWK
jgi:hypothetical protein